MRLKDHFFSHLFMTFIQKKSLFSNMKYFCSEFLTTFSRWKLKYNRENWKFFKSCSLVSLARNSEICLVSRKTSKVQEIVYYNTDSSSWYTSSSSWSWWWWHITIYQEDRSLSQNMPTLTKNLSESNTNTWTLR